MFARIYNEGTACIVCGTRSQVWVSGHGAMCLRCATRQDDSGAVVVYPEYVPSYARMLEIANPQEVK